MSKVLTEKKVYHFDMILTNILKKGSIKANTIITDLKGKRKPSTPFIKSVVHIISPFPDIEPLEHNPVTGTFGEIAYAVAWKYYTSERGLFSSMLFDRIEVTEGIIKVYVK